MRTHLELLAAEHERRGLSAADARAAARRDFGGVVQTKEAWQDERSFPALEALWRDMRQGARLIRRQPTAAWTSIVSLAIAIGAATAVYSVIDTLFFRQLAVVHPEELVIVQPQLKNRRWILPNPIFERLRREQTSLVNLVAVSDTQYLRTRFEDGRAGYVQASLVSGGYFSLLGVTPAVGRLLTAADDEVAEATTCVAVLGHAYWEREFHADPAVVGRRFQANAADCVVVGVAPASFPSHLTGYVADIWLPLRPLTSQRSLNNYFGAFFSGVFGRVKPGVSAAEAAASLTGVYQRIHLDQPAPPRGDQPIDPATVSIRLSEGGHGLHTLRAQFGQALGVLMALVVVVLTIAAVNVASVTLARGLARQPELATRRALGAGPIRLLGHLFAENAVIVVAGTLLGVVLAVLTAPLITGFITLSYQTVEVITAPTLRVGAFVGGIMLLLLLVVAVLPAYRLVRRRAVLPITTRWASDAPSALRTLRTMVVIQLALALLLVTAAGLFVQTLARLSTIDPGFRPDRILISSLGGESRFATATEDERLQRAVRYRDLESRLRAIPGVEAAGLSWLGFFGGSDLWIPIAVGQPQRRLSVRVDYITPSYFDVLGMKFTSGDTFRDGDRPAGRRPAVVNEAMARKLFGEDTIGKEFTLDIPAATGGPFAVVGIIANSKYNNLKEPTEPMMWLPIAEVGGVGMRSVTVRTASEETDAVAASVRQALVAVDPGWLVRRSTTLSTLIADTQLRERLLFGLSLGFGVIALVLSALGLYGTLTQAFARRRRELGVRVVLGARPETLRRMVLISAGWLIASAIVIAIPMALVAGGALRAFLFGVEPTDLTTLIASVVFVGVVALAAAYLPARRAAAVDPVEVIRGE